jgi:prepilin-type N-terminal cleavage/methylation domain-containing protein
MKRSDEGFTLIELLITIAIMGVVFSSVAAIAIVVLKAKRDADQALQNSSDLQVLATYFADDVAGATTSSGAGALGVLTLSGTDFSTGPWSHTYRLDARAMTRDGVSVASNICSASFAPGATAWSLTVDGCVLPTYASAGAPNTITATRRIP